MDPFDQLRIETPEQISLELPLAGIGSRFLAIAVDTLLQIAILFVLGILMAVAVPAMARLGAFGWFGPVLVVFLPFFITWVYFPLFETIWKGQTPGKRVAHIRVIKESGRPVNAFEAIARNLVRIVDFLPAMYGFGVLCMLLNSRHRRLGDFVAGTVVVHEAESAAIRPYSDDAPPGTAVTADVAQLAREDLLLMETYLQRRNDLPLNVQEKMAEEIASRIRAKAGIAKDTSESDDQFLEAVVRRIRENARF